MGCEICTDFYVSQRILYLVLSRRIQLNRENEKNVHNNIFGACPTFVLDGKLFIIFIL